MDDKDKKIANLTKLVAALDKLLACYRVGKNPGALLDTIASLRQKVGDSQ